MTTTQAKPTTETAIDSLLVAPELRDVCLRIPLPAPPTDEELERLNQRNGDWKIELGANAGLEVRKIAGGDCSDISGELGRQVANWRVAGGGGRDPDGTYKVSHPDLGEPHGLRIARGSALNSSRRSHPGIDQSEASGECVQPS